MIQNKKYIKAPTAQCERKGVLMKNFTKKNDVTVNTANTSAAAEVVKKDLKHAASNAASIFVLTVAVDAAVNIAQAIDRKFFK